MSIDFRIFNGLTRRFAGSADIIDWSFDEAMTGITTMTGSVKPLPRMHTGFVQDVHGLALVEDDEQIIWAGMLRRRQWKPRQGVLKLQLEDMSSLLYDRVRSPKLGDYIRKDTEQTTLWNDMITGALSGIPFTGFPTFARSVPAPTGNKHTLTFRGLSSYGKVFDNLAGRIRGLDWWLSYRVSADKRSIEYTINVGRRKTAVEPIIATYDGDPDGGGNIEDHDWDENSDNARTAVYTYGDGQPPKIPWGYNEDPALAKSAKIRREIAIMRSGTTQVATLNARARDERAYRDQLTTTVPITLPANKPDYRSYRAGDRVRLTIKDEWLDVYLPGAKIVSRTIAGLRDEPQSVKLNVDVSNYEAPREDEQAEVSGG